MSDNTYVALICDVVDSRNYSEREEIQKYLKDIIDYTNKIFSKSLVKKIMFSGGDEFQGLFENLEAGYLCARFLNIICDPIRIRIGLGVGKVSYLNDTWSSVETDGEAYYYARQAIEDVNNEEGIRVCSGSNQNDKVVNAWLLSSMLLSEQHTIPKYIMTLYEIMYPIYNPQLMASYLSRKELIVILNKRLELYKSLFKEDKLASFDNEFDNLVDYSTDLNTIIDNDDLVINKVLKRGLTNDLSAILGTSRQNIDKHLRVSHLKQWRQIDYSLYFYIKENSNEL